MEYLVSRWDTILSWMLLSPEELSSSSSSSSSSLQRGVSTRGGVVPHQQMVSNTNDADGGMPLLRVDRCADELMRTLRDAADYEDAAILANDLTFPSSRRSNLLQVSDEMNLGEIKRLICSI